MVIYCYRRLHKLSNLEGEMIVHSLRNTLHKKQKKGIKKEEIRRDWN